MAANILTLPRRNIIHSLVALRSPLKNLVNFIEFQKLSPLGKQKQLGIINGIHVLYPLYMCEHGTKLVRKCIGRHFEPREEQLE